MCDALWPDIDADAMVKADNPGMPSHFGGATPPPSSRAEAVLRLVGCPVTRDDAHARDGALRSV